MRKGEGFPDDQAEVVVSDQVIEWIYENVSVDEQEQVLADIAELCRTPWGKHTLSNRHDQKLAGFNTSESVQRKLRIVYRSTRSETGTGLIEVVAVGHRKEGRVYDTAAALVSTGVLDHEEVQQVWDMLDVLDGIAREIGGLEEWDYIPDPAPEGLQRAAVASGLLDAGVAALLSQDEINAAMAEGWDPMTHEPDLARALQAVLERMSGSADPDRLLALRQKTRCGTFMKIAKAACIRPRGHAGAHRASE